jgi:outer membrane murein-binding lipoprotein Lpp
MSEEKTQNLPDGRSFEERVFARFDAIDASLRDLNARVEKLESESERRAVETKPIWERALAEIIAVGQKVDAISQQVDTIERKLNVLGRDMLTLRADQVRLDDRMDKLESEHTR